MGLHTISTSYIPSQDPKALIWMEHFAASVRGFRGVGGFRGEPKGSALGLPADQAASLAALVRDFGDKLAIADCPITRTGPAITDKIAARNALPGATLAIQPLVKLIRAHPAVAEPGI